MHLKEVKMFKLSLTLVMAIENKIVIVCVQILIIGLKSPLFRSVTQKKKRKICQCIQKESFLTGKLANLRVRLKSLDHFL